MIFVDVLLPLSSDKIYTYHVPDEMVDDIKIGQIVLVPMRKQLTSGLVIEVKNNFKPDQSINYQEVQDIIDLTVFYSHERINFLKWIADYYMTPLGQVLAVTLTPGLMIRSKPYVELQLEAFESLEDRISEKEKRIIQFCQSFPRPLVSISTIKKQLGIKNLYYYLRKLENKGIIEISLKKKKKKPKEKKLILFQLPSDLKIEELKSRIRPNAHLQQQVVDHLMKNNNEPVPKKFFTHVLNIPASVLNTLIQRGLITVIEKEVNISSRWKLTERLKNITLNADQQGILEKIEPFIRKGEFFGGLLWGVTGSGKTQVYIELARKILDQNKSVLILLPEIGLTPQAISRYEYYLEREILVYHSKMNEDERYTIWKKVAENDQVIVVGVRSAIFLPFKNLGGIIVDEEHESSYKNGDSMPTYNARDLAIYLAKKNNAIFLGGSATPSLDSIYLTKLGKLNLFELKKRATKQVLPRIRFIDMKNATLRNDHEFPISENLLMEIQARLLSKEQVLIFKNLRGYSPYISCDDCNHILKCPSCDITLTYHKKSNKVHCHYCGFQDFVPTICPQCKGFNLQRRGEGTEKLDEYFSDLFKTAKIVRLDRDTIMRRDALVEKLQEIKEGEADILIGTKMVTKGLDFENLTLVAIIDADMDFLFPDFRAHERGFQTLIQVIGRSGRGEKKGDALLQTRDIRKPVFELIKKHDYATFVEKELEYRKSLGYPPYTRMILIEFSSEKLEIARKHILQMKQLLESLPEYAYINVLGPTFAPRKKLKNKFRMHLLIKIDRKYDRILAQFKKKLRNHIFSRYFVNKDIQIKIDVDPLDLL